MNLTDALDLAVEAKVQGHLNRYPQACIALAAEVQRLTELLKKDNNDRPQTIEIVVTAGAPAGDGNDPDAVPEA